MSGYSQRRSRERTHRSGEWSESACPCWSGRVSGQRLPVSLLSIIRLIRIRIVTQASQILRCLFWGADSHFREDRHHAQRQAPGLPAQCCGTQRKQENQDRWVWTEKSHRDTLVQWWFEAGTTSQTLAQLWTNTEPMHCHIASGCRLLSMKSLLFQDGVLLRLLHQYLIGSSVGPTSAQRSPSVGPAPCNIYCPGSFDVSTLAHSLASVSDAGPTLANRMLSLSESRSADQSGITRNDTLTQC